MNEEQCTNLCTVQVPADMQAMTRWAELGTKTVHAPVLTIWHRDAVGETTGSVQAASRHCFSRVLRCSCSAALRTPLRLSWCQDCASLGLCGVVCCAAIAGAAHSHSVSTCAVEHRTVCSAVRACLTFLLCRMATLHSILQQQVATPAVSSCCSAAGMQTRISSYHCRSGMQQA